MSNLTKKEKIILVLSPLIIILILIIVDTAHFSITKSQKEEPSSKEQQEEQAKNTITGAYEVHIAVDYSNKDILNTDADYIALIRIKSIDYSNWDSINKSYVLPFTYGSAEILKTYKGNLSKSINYKRMGALLEYNVWVESQADPNKLKELHKDKGNPIVDSRKIGDFHLEQDKIYLAFMKRYDCCNKENEYTIIAYEYGLHETKLQDKTKLLKEPTSSIKVKDNITNKYINLTDLVIIN